MLTEAAPAPPLIELRGIAKSFPGVQALDGVSLEVRARARCTSSSAKTAPASRR
jgi:ABC-type sugar transport system ATPase subunit